MHRHRHELQLIRVFREFVDGLVGVGAFLRVHVFLVLRVGVVQKDQPVRRHHRKKRPEVAQDRNSRMVRADEEYVYGNRLRLPLFRKVLGTRTDELRLRRLGHELAGLRVEVHAYKALRVRDDAVERVAPPDPELHVDFGLGDGGLSLSH
jgi:hypothetical protein